MNKFYVAKKHLRWAGILDIYAALSISLLSLIVSSYHFFYLLPNYSKLASNSSSGSTTSTYSSSFIKEKGYLEFFKLEIFDFALFQISLGHIIVLLFYFFLICFLSKIVLGCFSIFTFYKSKNVRLLYAAVSVVFFPVIGAIIAINTYDVNTSKIAPKYIASYSSLRFKFRTFLNNWLKDIRALDSNEFK